MSDDRTLKLNHLVHCDPEVVFRAWTDPVELAQWFSPRGFTSMASNQFRPGGQWRVVMHSADNVDYPMHGTYTDIEVPSLLRFTVDTTEHPKAWQEEVNRLRTKKQHLGMKCLMTVRFSPVDGGTNVEVHGCYDDVEDLEVAKKMGADQSWKDRFEKLDQHIAGFAHPAPHHRAV